MVKREEAATEEPQGSTQVKRKRGRPRKHPLPSTEVPKKRGRPRKYPVPFNPLFHTETGQGTKSTAPPPQAPPLEKVTKLGDPGDLIIPCSINGVHFPRTLCDTGAGLSSMAWSIARRLGLKDLIQPITKFRLWLADNAPILTRGIARDIPVEVDGVIIPTDFVVLDTLGEPPYGILLGRPFLHSTGAQIDMKHGTVTMTLRTTNKTITTREGKVTTTYSEDTGYNWAEFWTNAPESILSTDDDLLDPTYCP